jgi:spore germination protein GerM
MSREAGKKAESARGTGRLWWTLALLSLILALAVAALFWFFSRGSADQTLLPAAVEERAGELSGTRGVVLIFASSDGAGIASEQREVPSRDRIEEDLRRVLEALIEGPEQGNARSALPPGARLLGVFLDTDDGAAALDFSSELVARHPGGTSAETATLTSILGTVAWNFPSLRTCTLLVDGAPVTTLGGHVEAGRAFDLGRWR